MLHLDVPLVDSRRLLNTKIGHDGNHFVMIAWGVSGRDEDEEALLLRAAVYPSGCLYGTVGQEYYSGNVLDWMDENTVVWFHKRTVLMFRPSMSSDMSSPPDSRSLFGTALIVKTKAECDTHINGGLRIDTSGRGMECVCLLPNGEVFAHSGRGYKPEFLQALSNNRFFGVASRQDGPPEFILLENPHRASSKPRILGAVPCGNLPGVLDYSSQHNLCMALNARILKAFWFEDGNVREEILFDERQVVGCKIHDHRVAVLTTESLIILSLPLMQVVAEYPLKDYQDVAWSPDGMTIAVSSRNLVTILDIE